MSDVHISIWETGFVLCACIIGPVMFYQPLRLAANGNDGRALVLGLVIIVLLGTIFALALDGAEFPGRFHSGSYATVMSVIAIFVLWLRWLFSPDRLAAKGEENSSAMDEEVEYAPGAYILQGNGQPQLFRRFDGLDPVDDVD